MQNRATFDLSPAGQVGLSKLRRYLRQQSFRDRYMIMPSRTEGRDKSAYVRFAHAGDMTLAKLGWP